MVAVGLGMDVLFYHAVDGGVVAAKVAACLTVFVVGPWAAGVVLHTIEAIGKLKSETEATQAAALRVEGDLHVEDAVGINYIGDRVVGYSESTNIDDKPFRLSTERSV